MLNDGCQLGWIAYVYHLPKSLTNTTGHGSSLFAQYIIFVVKSQENIRLFSSTTHRSLLFLWDHLPPLYSHNAISLSIRKYIEKHLTFMCGYGIINTDTEMIFQEGDQGHENNYQHMTVRCSGSAVHIGVFERDDGATGTDGGIPEAYWCA